MYIKYNINHSDSDLNKHSTHYSFYLQVQKARALAIHGMTTDDLCWMYYHNEKGWMIAAVFEKGYTPWFAVTKLKCVPLYWQFSKLHHYWPIQHWSVFLPPTPLLQSSHGSMFLYAPSGATTTWLCMSNIWVPFNVGKMPKQSSRNWISRLHQIWLFRPGTAYMTASSIIDFAKLILCVAHPQVPRDSASADDMWDIL